jgi:hypothetical protein
MVYKFVVIGKAVDGLPKTILKKLFAFLYNVVKTLVQYSTFGKLTADWQEKTQILEDLVSLQLFSNSYDTWKPFSFLKEQQQILVTKCWQATLYTRNLMRQPPKNVRKRGEMVSCVQSLSFTIAAS